MDKSTLRVKTYAIRKAIILEHNNKCDECGTSEKLEVHHKSYENMDKNNLAVYCSKCHKRVHRRIGKPLGDNATVIIDIPLTIIKKLRLYKANHGMKGNAKAIVEILSKYDWDNEFRMIAEEYK